MSDVTYQVFATFKDGRPFKSRKTKMLKRAKKIASELKAVRQLDPKSIRIEALPTKEKGARP